MSDERTVSWLSPAAFEDLVEAVRARVDSQPESRSSPWLNVTGAAEYLVCSKKRIYDLVEMKRLRCARDGRRLLFRREWLDATVDA